MNHRTSRFELKPVSSKVKKRRKKNGKNIATVYDNTSDLSIFLDDYTYQPNLTCQLDDLSEKHFNQALLNEIILWKLNRYVTLSDSDFYDIDRLRNLRHGEHRKARKTLDRLLDTHGVDLAMASTILRFRNPDVFQIMDRHAYRAIFGEKYPLYPSSSPTRKIKLYWDYLDKLVELSRNDDLTFRHLDRLLYVFDKQVNGKL